MIEFEFECFCHLAFNPGRYFACFAFFALFWIWFSDVCAIGLDSYRDAFYLSVETQMTIGYGPDSAFRSQEAKSLTCASHPLFGSVHVDGTGRTRVPFCCLAKRHIRGGLLS